MKVRYTPRAFSDRERIIEYLRERSLVGARNVAASIRDAVAQLREHPLSGYRTNDPDVRVVFVVRYPYKIFYRVREIVEILHIRHTSRRERR
jgi:toxin ParE1/3/4